MDPDRTAEGDPFAGLRRRMVRDQIEDRGIRDKDVLDALGRVPRERFVPVQMTGRAYEDGALSIGSGQTISQPYIVARMTELLALAAWRKAHPRDRPRVLDVGTGSGYQAAVLVEMGADVVSIEQDQGLAEAARDRLAAMGYAVEVIVGDGSDGHPARAPYAAIIVAAAAPSVPPPLIDQLDDGGRLVVPVGPRSLQHLVVVQRAGSKIAQRQEDACVFVPLLGHHGQRG